MLTWLIWSAYNRILIVAKEIKILRAQQYGVRVVV